MMYSQVTKRILSCTKDWSQISSSSSCCCNEAFSRAVHHDWQAIIYSADTQPSGVGFKQKQYISEPGIPLTLCVICEV